MSQIPEASRGLAEFLDFNTEYVTIPLANGGTICSGWTDQHDPDAQLAGEWLSVYDAKGQQLFCCSAEDFTCMDTMTVQRTLLNFMRACAGLPSVPLK